MRTTRGGQSLQVPCGPGCWPPTRKPAGGAPASAGPGIVPARPTGSGDARAFQVNVAMRHRREGFHVGDAADFALRAAQREWADFAVWRIEGGLVHNSEAAQPAKTLKYEYMIRCAGPRRMPLVTLPGPAGPLADALDLRSRGASRNLFSGFLDAASLRCVSSKETNFASISSRSLARLPQIHSRGQRSFHIRVQPPGSRERRAEPRYSSSTGFHNLLQFSPAFRLSLGGSPELEPEPQNVKLVGAPIA